MCFDIVSQLPSCLKSNLLCWTLHSLDSSPDITTYNSNGYIYEVKNKNILGSICVREKEVTSMSVYYFYENGIEVRYYLLFTPHNKILVVKSRNAVIQVIATYENILKFEVFDFKSIGTPQIKFYFTEYMEPEIVDFSVYKEFEEDTMTDDFNNILDNNVADRIMPEGCCIAKSMQLKLKMIHVYIDELVEEYTQIKQTIVKNEPIHFTNAIESGSIKISQRDMDPKYDLRSIGLWHKSYGKCWTVGVRVVNTSNRIVPDLQLVIHEKRLEKFNYCFFSIPEVSGWPVRVPPIIQPGQELLILGVFQVPQFMFESEISVECILTCSKFKYSLKIATVEISASKALSQQKQLFSSVDDLMMLMTTHSNIDVIIESDCGEEQLLECILINKLSFVKLDLTKMNFFYSATNDIGIAVESISSYPFTWKLHIYTSEVSQFYLLVNALYDLFPEKTTISCR